MLWPLAKKQADPSGVGEVCGRVVIRAWDTCPPGLDPVFVPKSSAMFLFIAWWKLFNRTVREVRE